MKVIFENTDYGNDLIISKNEDGINILIRSIKDKELYHTTTLLKKDIPNFIETINKFTKEQQ